MALPIRCIILKGGIQHEKVSDNHFLAIISLLIGTNGFTQEYIVAKAGDTASQMAGSQRINAFMVEKIIGSQVINGKGETLGKIENLVVDIDSGRILYAVLGSGGVLGLGDKLFPVPWEALAALPSEGIFFLNKSKEQMGKAPFYNKSNLPDMTDLHWGEDIFKHYGIPGYVGRGSLSYLWLSRLLWVPDVSWPGERRPLHKNL